MRSRVEVSWARPENPGGQLEVLLFKRTGRPDPVRLNVKQGRDGRFECGYYELNLNESHTDHIVWKDFSGRSAKVSIWERCR